MEVLEKLAIQTSKKVCPLAEAVFNDIRTLPHGLELSFTKFIMGLVIDKDKVTFLDCAWVDVGVIVCFRVLLGSFNYLEHHMTILVYLFQSDQALF